MFRSISSLPRSVAIRLGSRNSQVVTGWGAAQAENRYRLRNFSFLRSPCGEENWKSARTFAFIGKVTPRVEHESRELDDHVVYVVDCSVLMIH